jgi:putative membrane protein
MPPTSVSSRLDTHRDRHHRVRVRGRVVLTLAEANSLDAAKRMQLEKFSGSFSHYDGLALIIVGIAIIAISPVRFIRTTRLIDDQQSHSAGSVRAELVLSVVLALIVATLTVYLALT